MSRNCVVRALVRELGRMDANHGEHVVEALLERAQFVQDMQAVAAAGGPEVQQHESAPEPGKGQRS